MRAAFAVTIFHALTQRTPAFLRPCRHCGHRELAHPSTPLSAAIYGTCASCLTAAPQCPGYARRRWWHRAVGAA
jgi:hypothetical protein